MEGWTYIEKSLQRFPKDVMSCFKDLVRQSLQTHQSFADSFISRIPAANRNLDAWQDTERIGPDAGIEWTTLFALHRAGHD